ncbi:alpha/beta fold hydrolase [Desulforhopalus sp. 52FAK]
MFIPKSVISKLVFLFSLSAIVLSGCATYTPEFRDVNGQIKSDSVAEIREVIIGGVKQSIIIRGNNRNNPILLIIPGGGVSILPVMSKSNSELEQHFIVVHWDIRGTGKSYFNKPGVQDMTFEHLINDTEELAELLLTEFNQEKLFIMGWSLGSAITMGVTQKRPDLFYANIAVCQVVNFVENEKIGYNYILAEARKHNNKKALTELTKLGFPPYAKSDLMHSFKVKGKWLQEFNGVIHDKNNLKKTALGKQYFSGEMYTKSKEYSYWDLFKIMWGIKFFMTSIYEELLEADLSSQVTQVEVPVYFFLGRHDYNAPASLAEQYVQELRAPYKEMVWFEHSAHYPFLEEPEKFNKEVEAIGRRALEKKQNESDPTF